MDSLDEEEVDEELDDDEEEGLKKLWVEKFVI